MKEPYMWDYTIRIKTKQGTYEYERDDVLEAVKLAEQHPDYEEFYMEHKKPTKENNKSLKKVIRNEKVGKR